MVFQPKNIRVLYCTIDTKLVNISRRLQVYICVCRAFILAFNSLNGYTMQYIFYYFSMELFNIGLDCKNQKSTPADMVDLCTIE